MATLFILFFSWTSFVDGRSSNDSGNVMYEDIECRFSNIRRRRDTSEFQIRFWSFSNENSTVLFNEVENTESGIEQIVELPLDDDLSTTSQLINPASDRYVCCLSSSTMDFSNHTYSSWEEVKESFPEVEGSTCYAKETQELSFLNRILSSKAILIGAGAVILTLVLCIVIIGIINCRRKSSKTGVRKTPRQSMIVKSGSFTLGQPTVHV